MKRKLYLITPMLLVLLLVSACSKNYPSNKYLGKLPMMAHDFGHIKTSERQKASILKKFNQEVALLLGTTLPCTIGKGTPLEVVEELKITEITLEGISYTGKLRFTKDIPATTGRITEAPEWDWCGNKHSQQFVIGLVMYSGDSIMCNLGCPTNTIIPYESLSQDNKNFIDYYFSMNMDAISILNDAVGGVTVEVTDDFSQVDATIGKGQAYFRSVLVDGPVSRINFCTIPERPIGSEIPVFGTYDAAFDEALRPYIDRLNEARGLIECPKAFKLAKKMMEEKAEEARLSQNRVYENLSFRANVIAFLKGMVLYVAHGEKWDKTMEEFVRWSLDYDLWCKMRFFGKAIEDAENGMESVSARGPKNLLDLLPTVFTLEDAVQVRSSQGIQGGSAKQMLANWKFRRYIDLYGEPCEDANRQQYTKTEEYLKK